MKRCAAFLAGTIALTANVLWAADAPRGSLLELHSCEVYAGPCVVNSEAMQDGRYMLRAWDFTGGAFQHVDLSGLRVAVLQLSKDNLAATGSKSGDAVVYLPESATAAQREALLAWLKSSQPDFHPATLQTRAVPLHFEKNADGYRFSAGRFVSVNATSLESCAKGSCGEMLWYTPRSATSLYTVATDNRSQVAEPLLQLTWTDGNMRSVFLARFGAPDTAKDLYVSLAELCGPSRTLF